MKTQLCIICEEQKHEGSSRACEIGIVCKECYPPYKKIKDALKEYLNKIIKRRIGEIKL